MPDLKYRGNPLIKGKLSDWVKAGFIEGAGTTNEQKFYSFADIKPGVGKFNYRLKQIDNNGNFEISNAPHRWRLESLFSSIFRKTIQISQSIFKDRLPASG